MFLKRNVHKAKAKEKPSKAKQTHLGSPLDFEGICIVFHVLSVFPVNYMYMCILGDMALKTAFLLVFKSTSHPLTFPR